MNKNVIVTLLVVLLIGGAIAAYLGNNNESTTAPPAAADNAIDAPAVAGTSEPSSETTIIEFTLGDMDGQPRKLSEWQGKARLVNFWATWCAPCRREIPLLKDTQAAHGDNNVQIIGVAVDFLDDVKAYAEEAQFNYPILVGEDDAMAAAESSGVEFIGLPFTLILSPSGELIKAHLGEIVESHIEMILDVFAAMERGEMDLAAAREALAEI